MERRLIPVACTLGHDDAAAQADEWTELVERASSTERIADGARLVFPAELAHRVRDLAEREAACCAFLTITTERTGGSIRLDVTSPDPGARPVIEALAGLTTG